MSTGTWIDQSPAADRQQDGGASDVLLPRLDRLSRGFLALGISSLLLLSNLAMNGLGIHYVLPGGALPEKIHPGTYFILLAFVLFLCARGNPVLAMVELTRRHTTVLAMFWCTALAIVYILVRDGAEGTQPGLMLTETYVTAALATVMLLEAPESYRRRCFQLFLAIVLANTALAIFEALTQTRLTPYYNLASKGELVEKQFRPTALFGHPLENALITALFLMAFLGSYRRPLSKLAIVGFLVVGLLAEGGRTSMAVALMLTAVWAAVIAARSIRAGRASYRGVLVALLAGSVLPTALFAGAVLAGLGERILANLYWDDSANTRSMLFKVFDYISLEQLLFGMSNVAWEDIKLQAAINWGLVEVENFWIVVLAWLGAVVFSIYIAGLFSFVWSFWRRGGLATRLATILLIIVCSSNNSLAKKDKTLTAFAAFTITAAATVSARSRQTDI